MRIIVVNSGSSSIKYESFDQTNLETVSRGLLERIGAADSRLKHRWRTASGGWEEVVETRPVADHREGFAWILEVSGRARAASPAPEVLAVGHRVVHGGEKFSAPALIDDAVLAAMEALIPLAPLHNPANVTGIRVMRELLPAVPQVAVFDTAFHQSMPAHAFHYALPQRFYADHHLRRYGFHGTSHHFVAKAAAAHLGLPLASLNLITLHLGNGASATAIRAGESIDTSMGFTPLEGLMMGTRSGDLDPSIPFYLARETGMALAEIEDLFNRQSGLKGICGVSDMRETLRLAGEGDPQARLALDMYCYRVKKYIGAYWAALGRVDALVFTGGVGENAPAVRAGSCAGLEGLGIALDPGKNEARSGGIMEIQGPRSPIRVLVIPTNEELEIARQTLACIEAGDAAA